MFVVSRQAEGVVSSVAGVSRFQLVVGRRENRDEIVLSAELKDETVNRENLAEELNRRFQDVCRMRLDRVEFVSAGSIPEGQPRLIDSRKWE